MLITLEKATPTTRIGIGLRADMPNRAVVHTVAAGTPASVVFESAGTQAILPFDALICDGGTACENAVHAVKLIRAAPAGPLEVEKMPCPPELERASIKAQAALRAAVARKEGLSQRVIVKPSADSVLGISFSPDWAVHSVIKAVKEDGLAATALNVGDVVKRFNGVACTSPAETAKQLRANSGRMELLIVPAGRINEEEMRDVEEEARQAMELEYDEDEEEGEDEYEYEDEALPPRAASDPFPPSPSRPPPVATEEKRTPSNAKRLPPTLSAISPASSHPSPSGPDPFPAAGLPGSTSTTRSGGPPLAAGTKPQGWREWLQQRKAGSAVTRPAESTPRATEQRI